MSDDDYAKYAIFAGGVALGVFLGGHPRCRGARVSAPAEEGRERYHITPEQYAFFVAAKATHDAKARRLAVVLNPPSAQYSGIVEDLAVQDCERMERCAYEVMLASQPPRGPGGGA